LAAARHQADDLRRAGSLRARAGLREHLYVHEETPPEVLEAVWLRAVPHPLPEDADVSGIEEILGLVGAGGASSGAARAAACAAGSAAGASGLAAEAGAAGAAGAAPASVADAMMGGTVAPAASSMAKPNDKPNGLLGMSPGKDSGGGGAGAMANQLLKMYASR